MHLKSKQIKQTLYVLTFLIFSYLIYLIIPLFFVESYFPLNPFIDTKFAENFDPKKFEKIEKGMNKNEVEKILGKP